MVFAFQKQLEMCTNMLAGSDEEMFLICSGSTITTGINLALQLQAKFDKINLEVNSYTIESKAEAYPNLDNDDFFTNKKFISCLQIKLFKN